VRSTNTSTSLQSLQRLQSTSPYIKQPDRLYQPLNYVIHWQISPNPFTEDLSFIALPGRTSPASDSENNRSFFPEPDLITRSEAVASDASVLPQETIYKTGHLTQSEHRFKWFCPMKSFFCKSSPCAIKSFSKALHIALYCFILRDRSFSRK
jgi:hypothetical protein